MKSRKLKWWWIPLLAINFVFWFMMATAVFSVLIPLDVGIGDIR